jgi:hypothetical protein
MGAKWGSIKLNLAYSPSMIKKIALGPLRIYLLSIAGKFTLHACTHDENNNLKINTSQDD